MRYTGKQIKDASGSDCEDGLAQDGRCLKMECSEHLAPVVNACPCGVQPDHDKGASLSRANLFVQLDKDTALFAFRTTYQTHIEHGGSWYYLDMECSGSDTEDHVFLMRPPMGGKFSPNDIARLENVIEAAKKTGGLIVIDTISGMMPHSSDACPNNRSPHSGRKDDD